MSYVPVVTPPPTPPSPRTRELAGLLSKVLEEYTKAHPATTGAEIRAAMRMALMSTGPDRSKLAAALGLGVGLGVALLALGLFYFRSAGDVEFNPIGSMIILAVIILLGIVLAVFKARGP